MLHLVKRQARWLAAAAVALAAVGAFLVWGLIGLGNGPLRLPATSSGVWGWSDLRRLIMRVGAGVACAHTR